MTDNNTHDNTHKGDQMLSDAELDKALALYATPQPDDKAYCDDVLSRVRVQKPSRQWGAIFMRPKMALSFVFAIFICTALISLQHSAKNSTTTAEEVEAFLQDTIDQDIIALEYAMVTYAEDDTSDEGIDIDDFLDEILGPESRAL